MAAVTDIGIDLGSSFITIYVKGKGIYIREPSVVAFDKETGRLRGGPDIISRGFVYMREAEELIDEARSAVLTTIAAMDVRPFNEWAPIKIAIRNTLRDFLFEKTKRTPMILPIVMEV